jgi:alpha-beta hydrolase superfamily lysophospholipase
MKQKLAGKPKLKHFIWIAVAFVLLLVAVGSFVLLRNWEVNNEADQHQAAIQSFYDIPSPLPSETPGALIRTEAISISVPGGGSAYRILYVSQLANGEPSVSSGMIFVPNTPAPAEGRKVVAWAHGTLGFGDDCAPSRSETPLGDMTNWIDAMMQRGWVVAATDYVGIGTKGNPYYLVGESEAHDVLNSVRAARNFDQAAAGNQFAAWGHSQGGHSALFTAVYASYYAPELDLVAVAVAAPAAELSALLSEQYSKTVAWAIGPDAAVSWPLVYPDLPLASVISDRALRSYEKSAYGCVMKQMGELLVRDALREDFFQINPVNNSQWYSASTAQTPPMEKIKVPLYVAQGLNDTVVLPNTTALLVQKACAAGANITTNWLGDTTHLQVAMVAGPSVTAWIQDRFDGIPPTDSCSQVLPVDPATAPPEPTG